LLPDVDGGVDGTVVGGTVVGGTVLWGTVVGDTVVGGTVVGGGFCPPDVDFSVMGGRSPFCAATSVAAASV